MSTITESALRKRINRRLARDCERLLTPREGSSFALEYGPHYVVDRDNIMRDWNCHLDVLGRDLGVLQAWEAVEGHWSAESELAPSQSSIVDGFTN